MTLRERLRHHAPGWALWAIAPFLAGFTYWGTHDGVRWDRVLGMLCLPTTLAFAGPKGRKLLLGFLPIGFVGLLYDFMGFVKNWGVTPERVHVCDLRDVEMRFFGVSIAGERFTLHDWFVLHHHPVADVLAALPYGTFIWAVMAYVVVLYLRDFTAQQRFGWGFLLLNVMGFITYHLYPAAPPWYFHQHGCLADLTVHGTPGPALERVDRMLGFAYFGGMYGRSNDVFGAVPSLHVAYPLYMAVVGWPLHGRAVRAALVAFYLAMCAAAVYLDHHWVIDVILGTLYTFIAYAIVVRAIPSPSAALAPPGASPGPRSRLERLS